MTCDETHELITGLLDGELLDAERASLESHLQECPWSRKGESNGRFTQVPNACARPARCAIGFFRTGAFFPSKTDAAGKTTFGRSHDWLFRLSPWVLS